MTCTSKVRTRVERMIAEKACLSVSDLADPATIRRHVVTDYKRGPTTVWLCTERSADTFDSDFCSPIGVETELRNICKQRQALKKAYDDSMSLVYQLNNKIARGEI